MATAIGVALPDHDVVFVNDNANVPYGTKTEEQLLEFTLPKLMELSDQRCAVIVIACNSVSTTILDQLQKEIAVPLIGVEPMVKQACEATKKGVVAVCATPMTLKSHRYKQLCKENAGDKVIIEPDCSQWAFMIERDALDRKLIEMAIMDTLEQGADVIVLGCTHYHWIESLIKSIAGTRAVVLQPEESIIEEVKLALEQLG